MAFIEPCTLSRCRLLLVRVFLSTATATAPGPAPPLLTARTSGGGGGGGGLKTPLPPPPPPPGDGAARFPFSDLAFPMFTTGAAAAVVIVVPEEFLFFPLPIITTGPPPFPPPFPPRDQEAAPPISNPGGGNSGVGVNVQNDDDDEGEEGEEGKGDDGDSAPTAFSALHSWGMTNDGSRATTCWMESWTRTMRSMLVGLTPAGRPASPGIAPPGLGADGGKEGGLREPECGLCAQSLSASSPAARTVEIEVEVEVEVWCGEPAKPVLVFVFWEGLQEAEAEAGEEAITIAAKRVSPLAISAVVAVAGICDVNSSSSSLAGATVLA